MQMVRVEKGREGGTGGEAPIQEAEIPVRETILDTISRNNIRSMNIHIT